MLSDYPGNCKRSKRNISFKRKKSTCKGMPHIPVYMDHLFFADHREKERALAQGLSPPIMPQSKADLPRFTGGGFSLKQSQQAMA